MKKLKVGPFSSPLKFVAPAPKFSGAELLTNAVVPGQPLPISWDIWSFIETFSEEVTARVYLDNGNVLLYESPPTFVQSTPMGFFNETALQQAIIEPTISGGAANDLYHFGTKTLRLDVSSNGTLLTGTDDLLVVPEEINSGWWEWTEVVGTPDPNAPVPPDIPLVSKAYDFIINHQFQLAGRMVNHSRSPNATMTGSVTLLETDQQTNQTVELENHSFTIATGVSQDAVFAPITKNWTWLIPGLWVENPSESLVKSWSYAVRFNMSDSYGNVYSDTLSLALHITISVSKEKHDYAQGALAAKALGVIAGIFSFGAGAAVFDGIAAGLGAKALDPPEPDPHFQEVIHVRASRFAEDSIADAQVPELRLILRLAERILAHLDALGEIENRLLGARIAKDLAAIHLQTQTYRTVEQSLQATVAELLKATTGIVATLQAKPEFTRAALAGEIVAWQRYGIHPDVRIQLTRGGCSEETIAGMAVAVREPMLALLAQDIGQVLNLLASSLGRVARGVYKNSSRLFHGETPDV